MSRYIDKSFVREVKVKCTRPADTQYLHKGLNNCKESIEKRKRTTYTKQIIPEEGLEKLSKCLLTFI